ncbi:hypothetical protein CWC16_00860 [Pseudoalteromonas sp. S3776]|nr:hypothetical protein CWC16_00860 [Pseudoalteromonas sp. S3776]
MGVILTKSKYNITLGYFICQLSESTPLLLKIKMGVISKINIKRYSFMQRFMSCTALNAN